MDKSKRLKARILEEYNSILDFSKKVKIPCSTLQSALEKENGIDNMASGRVLKLCQVLNLDPYTMERIEKKEPALKEEERALLKNYRKLDEHGKRVLETLTELELERIN